jgi:hypothetical protein
MEDEQDTDRIQKFIEAFTERYGRAPEPEDAEGDFKMQVAQDMNMSVGGARYYIRAATSLRQ